MPTADRVEAEVQRRLAAILAADVVGYSRLMHGDEVGTLTRLRELRTETIEPLVAEHGGRVVKLVGDGFLCEFPAATSALACADNWLARTAEGDMHFRIGVHAGEVIEEDGDLYGDTVNIAARLEALAAPGTACVSAAVHAHLGAGRERLVPLGPRTLKNISGDVTVFQLGTAVGTPTLLRPEADSRPSLIVLPFECRVEEAAEVAEGIADEISYALSRIRSITVISRPVIRRRALNLDALVREHGVRYVVGGTVRAAGRRLRIIVHLTVAETGEELWSERFEGVVEEVFELQDRITEQVAQAAGGRVRSAEIARARRRRPDSLDAYACFLRALPQIRLMTKAGNEEAQRLLRRAMDLDPDYVLAKALHGWLTTLKVPQGWGASEEDVAEAIVLARQAVADTDDPEVLTYAGYALGFLTRDPDEGLAQLERAIAIDPQSAQAHAFLGWLLGFRGDARGSRAAFVRAEQLNPLDAFAFRTHGGLCFATFFLGEYEASVGWGLRGIRENPDFTPTYHALIPALVRAGRREEAAELVTRLRSLVPGITCSEFAAMTRFAHQPFRDALVQGLAAAGLPLGETVPTS